MIPCNFDYYRPDTIEEAIGLFVTESRAGKKVYYYGGGTEIITMARVGDLSPDVVIDIKRIPECSRLGYEGDRLVLGAALTLTQVFESGMFALLGLACSRIADHSAQGKITLGGNVAGTIIYRESVLPLLLADATVAIAGADGMEELPIASVFKEKMKLNSGEFIVQFSLGKNYADMPYAHIKKTAGEKIGYPLLTACALRTKEGIRAAFSGLCAYPFRSAAIERIMNQDQILPAEAADRCVRSLPAPVHNDITGQAEYRAFIFKETLTNIMESLGEKC